MLAIIDSGAVFISRIQRVGCSPTAQEWPALEESDAMIRRSEGDGSSQPREAAANNRNGGVLRQDASAVAAVSVMARTG